MLKAINITKDFSSPFSLRQLATLDLKRRPGTRALNDVSFTLAQGSTLAVLGPNGAGKTTLLKVISTLILPEKGTIELNGLRLGKDDEQIKARIGLLSSCERSFYWRLTGKQNLEFFAAMYGLYGKHAEERIKELVRLFKITYLDKRFDSYSTGMQQKCGLIRALLHDPALLLLDEPTKSLDHSTAQDFRNFIKEFLVKKQGKTVIFTTHHMEEALDFADCFMILYQGNMLAFGSLEELRAKAGKPAASLKEIFVEFTSRG
ncbi:MAG: ABC transporter ATP-binding protein [Candidatus Omnitrophota bacterium]